MFQIENVPDEDSLYYRVHKSYLREGNILPGVFKERGEGDDKGMSTDWSEHSTAEESLNRAKTPKDNGILQGNVGEVRTCGLSVIHAPIYPDNQAHTNVKGLEADLTDFRLQLSKIFATWAIGIENK